MRRFLSFLLVIFILSAISVLTAHAAETDKPPSHVNITVVMPDAASKSEPATEAATQPKSEPMPKPATPPAPKLYPTDVREILENGVREIVKTYELSSGEKPSDIPRDSFERNGWLYTLSDVVKKESSSADTREYTELVERFSAANDTQAILKLFDASYEFINEDGYMGIMRLDISTLKVETAGTKSSAYAVTATREYPNLSSNDTSFIPKTVTDGGRTLDLSNIQWRTQNSVTIDSDQLPESYTAVVTYTGTAYKTTVTGYTATAEYRGTLSKIITGKTMYTAHFIGTEIEPETVPVIPVETVPATETSVPDIAPETTAAIEAETESEIEITTQFEAETEPAEPDTEPDTGAKAGEDEPSENDSETENNVPFVIILIALLTLIVGAIAGYFVPRVIKTIKTKKGEKYL